MDTLLKILQGGFYITASLVAVLTYLKAKDGLLNTVNTEYQKRVMDRLAELSVALFDEFNRNSDYHWSREHSVEEILNNLHEEIKPYKHEIITGDRNIIGIPISKKEQRLYIFLSEVKSDPFIPTDIRYRIVNLIEGRTEAIRSAHIIEIGKYQDALKLGKYWDTLDTNHDWLHSDILDHLYTLGYGISDIENKVHEIRADIQLYFEGFNPIKKVNK